MCVYIHKLYYTKGERLSSSYFSYSGRKWVLLDHNHRRIHEIQKKIFWKCTLCTQKFFYLKIYIHSHCMRNMLCETWHFLIGQCCCCCCCCRRRYDDAPLRFLFRRNALSRWGNDFLRTVYTPRPNEGEIYERRKLYKFIENLIG